VKKFNVEYEEVLYYSEQVEAEDIAQARKKFIKKLMKNKIKPWDAEVTVFTIEDMETGKEEVMEEWITNPPQEETSKVPF
jgi:hypothetical protein